MNRLTAWIDSETAPLTHVVVGLPDTFHHSVPEVINETQKRYYFTGDHPDREKLIGEFREFRELLQKHGVSVYQLSAVDGVPDQLTPRDIGFVIADTLVIPNMAKNSRKRVWRGLENILRQLETPVLYVPEDINIEGGDIVVHDGVVYVGISERTNREAADYLAQKFPQFEVMAIPLRPPQSGQEILHLDCAFLPVGNRQALFYPGGFVDIPGTITERYSLIEVTSEEQQELAVNVLSLTPRIVVSRSIAARTNALLRDAGLDVIEIDFDETPKTGGSFRCCTLPLRRGEQLGG